MIIYHESGGRVDGVNRLGEVLKVGFKHEARRLEPRSGLRGRVLDLLDSKRAVGEGFHHALNVRLARPGMQLATFADGIPWVYWEFYQNQYGMSPTFASYERRLFEPALGKGTRLVAISPESRAQAETLGFDVEQTIPPSLHPAFKDPPASSQRVAGSILWVGSNHPRKSWTSQVELLDDSNPVTWIGPEIADNACRHHEWQTRRAFESSKKLLTRFTHVTDEALRYAYRTHQFLGVSSIHEGFNLPVWEAASQGCLPVLLTGEEPSWYRTVWKRSFPDALPESLGGLEETEARAFSLAASWQSWWNTPESYVSKHEAIYRSLGWEGES